MTIGDTTFVQACPTGTQYCTAYDAKLTGIAPVSNGQATVSLKVYRLGDSDVQPINIAAYVNGKLRKSKKVNFKKAQNYSKSNQVITFTLSVNAGDTVGVVLHLTSTSGLKSPSSSYTKEKSKTLTVTVPKPKSSSSSQPSSGGGSPPSSGGSSSPKPPSKTYAGLSKNKLLLGGALGLAGIAVVYTESKKGGK